MSEIDNNLLVSVVVCSYNRLDTIFRAIESILSQKRKFNIEVLVGDDGSSDGSREKLLELQTRYPELIKLVFHEKNMGIGGNWATLVSMAKGKYVASCDDDDYWHYEDKLQLQVDFLERNPEFGLVHTDYRTLNVNSNELIEVNLNNKDENISLIQSIFKGKYKILASSVLYRKELLDKYIPYDEYINYRFTIQDWPTWVILSKYTKFYHLPISTVTYSIGVESITTFKTYESVLKRFDSEKKMYKFLCDMFPEDIPFDEKGYDSYVNSILLNQAIKQKDYPKANEFGKKIENKSLKVLCSQNRILFWIYVLLKRIKNS
jgi:glycosyltransferase involved in cell wall biosynthesis